MLDWLFQYDEETELPSNLQSTLYVIRNGSYEPQNLMPIMPVNDLEFNGFNPQIGRRGSRLKALQPEVRKASLTKNPVNVRRDSLKAFSVNESAAHAKETGGFVSFKVTFDTLSPVKVSLHLFVEDTDAGLAIRKGDGADDTMVAAASPLLEDSNTDVAWIDRLMKKSLDMRTFDSGLGHVYQSPPMEHSSADFVFDPSRPTQVPLTLRLETQAPGLGTIVHYAHLSLQQVPSFEATDESVRTRWQANVIAQKMCYQNQCFVLREVFGACPQSLEIDGEGSMECIICFAERRDTAVLPCRHLCFCIHCAGIARYQCDRCPVCRQLVTSLLQFHRPDDQEEVPMSFSGNAAGSQVLGTQSPIAS